MTKDVAEGVMRQLMSIAPYFNALTELSDRTDSTDEAREMRHRLAAMFAAMDEIMRPIIRASRPAPR
jgi:hypothetical protein